MRLVFLLFVFIVTMLFGFAAQKVRADSIAHQGSDWVRITALACTDAAVLAKIAEAGDDPLDYRAAVAEFRGQSFAACWKPLVQRESVYLRYGDGDQGLIPFDALKPLKEA
jgi:hypothetical protein